MYRAADRATRGESSGSRRCRAVAQAVVGDQLDHARLGLVGVDHRLGDPGHLQQHRFDLGQLDTVAADLHLGVDAAVVLDLAVTVDPAEVTGSIDPARGLASIPRKSRMNARSVRSSRLTYPRASPMPAMPISPSSPGRQAACSPRGGG